MCLERNEIVFFLMNFSRIQIRIEKKNYNIATIGIGQRMKTKIKTNKRNEIRCKWNTHLIGAQNEIETNRIAAFWSNNEHMKNYDKNLIKSNWQQNHWRLLFFFLCRTVYAWWQYWFAPEIHSNEEFVGNCLTCAGFEHHTNIEMNEIETYRAVTISWIVKN